MKTEILEKLKELRYEMDTEAAHSDADELLCELLIELGHQDIVDAFNQIDKWYA